MKVKNMTSGKTGKAIPNQFIIIDGNTTYFQSYNSIIIKQVWSASKLITYLDEHYWDYSTTTGKYRNNFLGETKKETQAKIDSGEYLLTDLNS